MIELLDEIQKCLIGVPQYDMGYEIDESDESYFQVDEGDGTRPMTDGELKSSYPVIWARRKLIEIIELHDQTNNKPKPTE